MRLLGTNTSGKAKFYWPLGVLSTTLQCRGRKPRGGSVKCPQVALRDPLLLSSPLPLCLLQPAPLPKAHIARATLPLFTTFSFLHPCSQRMLIWQCPLLTGLLGTAPSSSAKGILGSSAPVLGRLSRCSPSGNWGGGPASSHIPRHGLQDGTWEWLTKCQGC